LTGRQLDCLFIRGKGGVDVARRLQRLCEVVLGRVIIGEQPCRSTVPLDGLPPFLQLRVRPRAVELIRPRIGLQRDRLIEVGHRLSSAASADQHLTQIAEGTRVVRVGGDGRLQLLRGRIDVAGHVRLLPGDQVRRRKAGWIGSADLARRRRRRSRRYIRRARGVERCGGSRLRRVRKSACQHGGDTTEHYASGDKTQGLPWNWPGGRNRNILPRDERLAASKALDAPALHFRAACGANDG
jgi:hypothetical protein